MYKELSQYLYKLYPKSAAYFQTLTLVFNSISRLLIIYIVIIHKEYNIFKQFVISVYNIHTQILPPKDNMSVIWTHFGFYAKYVESGIDRNMSKKSCPYVLKGYEQFLRHRRLHFKCSQFD